MYSFAPTSPFRPKRHWLHDDYYMDCFKRRDQEIIFEQGRNERCLTDRKSTVFEIVDGFALVFNSRLIATMARSSIYFGSVEF